MIIDIHCHLLSPEFDTKNTKTNFYTKMFWKKLGINNYTEYVNKLKTSLENSKINKVILVAVENNPLSANNKQIIDFCQNDERFLYGANLNPYSVNVEEDFNFALQNNAVLVKVLPSFQEIDLSDKKCIPFFELLINHKLPLLVHTGIEHTYKNNKQYLNNPKNLKLAAQMGVKIICAHCGTRMYLFEKSYYNEWKKLALKYDNVYGDLSAMVSPVRKFYLKDILKNNKLSKKVLFGTDYPAFPFEFFRNNTHNLFNDWYNSFKKIGFKEEFFARANEVLNL